MTDQTIPADKVRRARQWARDTLDDVENGANVSAYARDAARTLIAMMPRPTLADMTPDEQDECAGMQADLAQGDRVVILDGTPDHDGRVQVLESSLDVYRPVAALVTPRPDLPRLEWPGTEKPAPAPALPEGWRLADHPQRGRVIVTTTEPDREGDIFFIYKVNSAGVSDTGWCKPAELTYPGQESDPAPATITVGSEWGDIDALTTACRESGRDQITVTDRDGDVSVWSAVAGWWETGSPDFGFEPYTILHTGKEAGQ